MKGSHLVRFMFRRSFHCCVAPQRCQNTMPSSAAPTVFPTCLFHHRTCPLLLYLFLQLFFKRLYTRCAADFRGPQSTGFGVSSFAARGCPRAPRGLVRERVPAYEITTVRVLSFLCCCRWLGLLRRFWTCGVQGPGNLKKLFRAGPQYSRLPEACVKTPTATPSSINAWSCSGPT